MFFFNIAIVHPSLHTITLTSQLNVLFVNNVSAFPMLYYYTIYTISIKPIVKNLGIQTQSYMRFKVISI